MHPKEAHFEQLLPLIRVSHCDLWFHEFFSKRESESRKLQFFQRVRECFWFGGFKLLSSVVRAEERAQSIEEKIFFFFFFSFQSLVGRMSKKQKKNERLYIFVSEDTKPWQIERIQLFCNLFKADFSFSFHKQVSHVVTNDVWLKESCKRSVEYLYLLAEAPKLKICGFDWVCNSITQETVLDCSPYLLRCDQMLQEARTESHQLLRGNIFFFSGEKESEKLRKSGLVRTPVLRADLIVLAALQGARVVDPSGLPNPLPHGQLKHRGYDMHDLQKRHVVAEKGKENIYRVLVAGQEGVSKLGLEIYLAEMNIRPILADWLVVVLQSQKLVDVGKYEIF
jgi:hypothetical protein